MEDIAFLLRNEMDIAGPEEKYAVIRMLHMSKRNEVKSESLKGLASELCISVQSLVSAADYLELNGFVKLKGDWIKKKGGADVSYQFTSEFPRYTTNGKTQSKPVSNYVCSRLELLLKSDALNGLSSRAAVKLFLLTLLAHSDCNGVVRDMSLKDFERLFGRFSKDRHRSQLARLKRDKFILEYDAGMSGSTLFGKLKSEYLINVFHPVFSGAQLISANSLRIFKALPDGFYMAERFSRLAVKLRGDVFVTRESVEVDGDFHLLKSDYAKIQWIQMRLEPKNERLFWLASMQSDAAFDGDVKGFQLQRYCLKLAFLILRDSESRDVNEELSNRILVEELFSEKYINEVSKAIGVKFSGILIEQVERFKEVESELDDVKFIITQVSAITWFVGRFILDGYKQLKSLLDREGIRLSHDCYLELYENGGKNTLYIFNGNGENK